MSLLGWELCSVGLASVCTLAVGAPAQLSLGYVCPCPTCPRDLAGGSCPAVGAPARLSPRSCVVWPWRWELCSIVASVLCRVALMRRLHRNWDTCLHFWTAWQWLVYLIWGLVIFAFPCGLPDSIRRSSDVCLSSFWKVCDNCLVVRWLSQ